MRVLLTSNASYVPPRGGSTRSNLAWLERLAAAGHHCEIVCAAAEQDTPERRERVRQELEQQRLPLHPESVENGVERRSYAGIAVHAVAEPARMASVLAERISRFGPEWVLVSSEDLSHSLLREAARRAPGKLVYLAHTPQFFPFGPESWNADPNAAQAVRRAAAVIAIGSHTAAYVERHTGRAAEVIHPPIYGGQPPAECGSFDNELITVVNPCAVKGISIFLDLARAFPELRFGALPGWGTTHQDRAALSALPNVEILRNVRDIDEVLSRTRILLMPSLWYEGFGLIVMEAMLRGVPVISSDSGGLVEAKQDTGFVIPVRPVESYQAVFDDRHMPKPVIPPQELAPWREALSTLLRDRHAYDRERQASLAASRRFVARIDPGRFTGFLAGLQRAESTLEEPDPLQDAISRLSPEKRALLLQRLRKTKP
jgi:glycosyltransferase involved in cell wall biosynthesis